MIPFQLPKFLKDLFTIRRDKNALTLGKKKMTGVINCTTSKVISL